jgi:hypothetical protein
MRRSVPGILTNSGSAFLTKQGSVVIPNSCRTATICAPESVVLNGTSVARTSPTCRRHEGTVTGREQKRISGRGEAARFGAAYERLETGEGVSMRRS